MCNLMSLCSVISQKEGEGCEETNRRRESGTRTYMTKSSFSLSEEMNSCQSGKLLSIKTTKIRSVTTYLFFTLPTFQIVGKGISVQGVLSVIK